MKMKKIVTAGILGTLLTVAGVGGFSSLANNHGDTGFKFSFLTANSSSYTNVRPKTDNSYVYVNHQSGVPFTIRVYKANNGAIRCTPTYATRGNAYFVTNYAFEDNNNKTIDIKMCGNAAYGGSASGLWSPDSI